MTPYKPSDARNNAIPAKILNIVSKPGAGAIFVDHDHALRVLVVGSCKIPTAQKSDAARRQITRRNRNATRKARVLQLFWLRLALQYHSADSDVPSRRQ